MADPFAIDARIADLLEVWARVLSDKRMSPAEKVAESIRIQSRIAWLDSNRHRGLCESFDVLGDLALVEAGEE